MARELALRKDPPCQTGGCHAGRGASPRNLWASSPIGGHPRAKVLVHLDEAQAEPLAATEEVGPGLVVGPRHLRHEPARLGFSRAVEHRDALGLAGTEVDGHGVVAGHIIDDASGNRDALQKEVGLGAEETATSSTEAAGEAATGWLPVAAKMEVAPLLIVVMRPAALSLLSTSPSHAPKERQKIASATASPGLVPPPLHG